MDNRIQIFKFDFIISEIICHTTYRDNRTINYEIFANITNKIHNIKNLHNYAPKFIDILPIQKEGYIFATKTANKNDRKTNQYIIKQEQS